MSTKRNLQIGGAFATGAGIIALSNSLGWALLFVGAAIAAALFIRIKRN